MIATMNSRVWRRASPSVILAGALFATFAISVSLYAIGGTNRVRRVLLFPDPRSGKLVAEERFLPRTADSEDALALVVKEIMLGPQSIELARLTPRSARIRSVMLRDREAYVDLSTDIVLDIGQTPLGVAGTVQALANNLYLNFPRLRRVKVFVNGQVPQVWGMDLSNLVYSREMLR